MSSTHWMRTLAAHYDRACERAGDKPLMLLSDIDGTILDMRHMILSVLKSYDRAHQTVWFERLVLDDVDVHENQVDRLLQARGLAEDTRRSVMEYYVEQRWAPRSVAQMHRPFRGVLEMIRWFQLQPRTVVGLVSGRPNAIREDTLRSLNSLGKPCKVAFAPELLYLNPGDWEEGVPGVKVAGLGHFREQGFHVFAFIDNEPDNLDALANVDRSDEVLFLHADTIFESKRKKAPRRAVRGREYRLEELIAETALPGRVELVWHGINTRHNLRQFLASKVRWAEVDARLDRGHSDVVLRHDSIERRPLTENEELLALRDVIHALVAEKRALKLDLKGGGELLDHVLALVAAEGLRDHDLWFNSRLEDLGEAGFRRISETHPGAVLQCPADFLRPLIRAAPDKAHDVLEMLRGWGLDRFSFRWDLDEPETDAREIFEAMDGWGYDINIYNVPDLESFLEAVLLLPRSVTSDFNFPRWHYFGEGPGREGKLLSYREAR